VAKVACIKNRKIKTFIGKKCPLGYKLKH
jgi:hypothetical protein